MDLPQKLLESSEVLREAAKTIKEQAEQLTQLEAHYAALQEENDNLRKQLDSY